MNAKALIDVETGGVISWGFTEYTPTAGQAVVEITDHQSYTGGRDSRHFKIVDGLFVAMNAAEREAVDRVFPRRRGQRLMNPGDVLVSTRDTDPDGGWGDVIALTTVRPLLAGFYQVTCGFELAMIFAASAHTAQAQLEINGSEVASWHNPRTTYTHCQYVDTIWVATGERPTFRLRIRRLGAVPGTARARRANILITPAGPIEVV